MLRIRLRRNPWPCLKKQYLVVGCESSGTTPISHLLFRGGSLRFLIEGWNVWVWQVYKSTYQGRGSVREYPRLQLFDALKVPGFAAILEDYVTAFPNAAVIYVVRDPRDVVVSACKTWGVTRDNGLSSIPWVAESWLGIQSRDPVVRLALRWRTYLRQSQRVPGVTYVRYEDFYEDKVGFVMRLASKLGIRVDEGRVTRLCDRQASGSSVRDYPPEGPGAWRRGLLNERDVKAIEETCGHEMRQWNYS